MNHLYDFSLKKIRLLLGVWMVLFAVPKIAGQVLFTESFNYPVATAISGNNWVQAAAGTPTVAVSSGNLNFVNTIGNGMGNKVTLSSVGQDVYKTFTTTTLSAAVPAIYAHAVVNVSAAQTTGDYFLSLGTTTTSIARVYIRPNGAGFSFGVLRSTGTVEYESVERPFNTNIRLVLKYEQVTGTTNDIVKIYINPAGASEPAVANVSHTGTAADTASFGAIQLYQGSTAVTTIAPTLEIDNIVVNTTWAGVTLPIYDYGDVPASYDNTKDNVFAPATHSLLTNLYLGSIVPDLEYTPASVASGADNNGANGDGTDEDAVIFASSSIKKGVVYSLSMMVNNPATATRYLYGWIDFNNDGKFQSTEMATVVTFTTAGSTTQTLTWTALQTSTIAAGNTTLYMRVRLSSISLIDATDATMDERSVGNGAISTVNALNAAISPTGEVEDYQISVSTLFDYGDVPVSYENDKDGILLPALHLPLTGLTIGTQIDMEANPSSVAIGADNNGTNGDGADEDGIITVSNITKGLPYSISVPVNNPAAVTRYLYGWIDFNNDGKFQVEELADAVVTFSTNGASTQTLTWSAAKTSTLVSGAGKRYMRIRLSGTSLFDFTTAGSGGANVDERSIGNGATSATVATNLPTVAVGEVEDYQITINTSLEYGDLPISFENDKDNVALPATSSVLSGLHIGKLIDAEIAPASVISPNENNIAGDNAIGLIDEDGLSTFTSVNRGVAYSITVPVNVPATLAGTTYLYGWLDLNGDGRFQLGEVATATNAVTGENYLTLTWTPAQTTTIPVGTSRIYLRLRLSNLSLVDFTGAAGGTTIDERSVGNGATSAASAVNNILLPYGEIEDYQLLVDLYDFGDAPVSYDTNNTPLYQPARQISTIGYKIGATTDFEAAAQSVTVGNDNNGTNGDGADEDGITGALPVVTKGASFNFSVPINSSVASSIIAWIDFNNNGKFEASEAAYTTSTSATTGYQATPVGTSIVTFWFRGAQTGLIPVGVTNLYSRIRLTTTAGADNAATTAIDERSVADGATTGIYTTPYFGEVEDYRFSVGTEVYDFGDVPTSYEMDKDGTANPANFKPARNNPTDALFLGASSDRESTPNSVVSGNDNNGANGDGSDEDGLVSQQLYIRSGAINSYAVALNNNTGAAATLYSWIDLNNNGRFEAGEAATAVSVPNGATSATISFTAAQISTIAAAANKVYLRLRLIQPETGVTIADLTLGANNTVVDERAIADGLSTGLYGVVSGGEVEDYQLTIIRDFGDVPSSYENGNPASQTNNSTPELTLGATVDYELINNPVASGSDNNGLNGDGADEDAVVAVQTITSGTPFSISIPVNTTLTGIKNLYAWIDFNGDGIFNGNEAATVSQSVTAGTTGNFLLTWPTTTVSPLVLTAGKTYVRLRVSTAALAANANAATPTLIDTRSYGQSISTGEIEDYQFNVTGNYDYGDVPISYDMNKDGLINPANYLPARQAISPLLQLGNTTDIEISAQHVATGADNNGTNGDGADEDGTTPMPVHRGTIYYSKVSVTNNTGAAKNLYGWIDFNNDGRFQVGEAATTVSVPSSPTQQTVYLSWTAANTNTIAAGVNNVYMRLRLSNVTLTDFGAGANSGVVDERAIGDGLAGTAAATPYGVAQIGEIEDYLLPVTTIYDFGDAPDTYDTSRNAIIAPARQAVSSALYMGDLLTDNETGKQTSANATGDDTSNTDDEDGTVPATIYTGGGNGYSLRVKVTNNTAAARTLYGWIDFNNSGRFESGEMQSVAVANSTNGGYVTLTWTNAQSTITGTVGTNGLMMRLRLSQGALADFITGAPGALVDERALADGINTGEYAASPVIFNGEVEDYTIPVTNQVDYGDAPVSYDQTR